MANDLIFNPLLKKGFQEAADTGSIEAEIEDLRQKKITKFFSATDTLEDGEIAQYQGNDDSGNGLVNGYFYKKTGVSVVIAPPINVFKFTNDFPLNQPFVLGDYNFVFGNYYQVQNYNIQSSIINQIYTNTYENKYISLQAIAVNNKIFNRTLNRFEIVTAIDNHNYVATTDQGSQIDISSSSISSFTDLIQVGNNDGTESFIFLYKLNGFYTLLVHWDFDNNTIIDWFPFQCLYSTRNTPYSFNTERFSQTDTQPRTPGVTVADGVLQISLPVEFSGNITVHGTEVVVTTEQIQSEKDFVKLRYNNPLALAAGETSGISVNNYDGNNTDCILAVDANGWARVGDSSGTLEKLATIEENPTDGAFLKYNETDKELQSTSDGSALTVTFTDSAVTGNVENGDSLAVAAKKISNFFLFAKIKLTPETSETIESGFKRLIVQLTTLYPSFTTAQSFRVMFDFYNQTLVEGGAYNTNQYSNVDNHYYYCNFTAIRLLGQANTIYQFGWSGTNWYFREI